LIVTNWLFPLDAAQHQLTVTCDLCGLEDLQTLDHLLPALGLALVHGGGVGARGWCWCRGLALVQGDGVGALGLGLVHKGWHWCMGLSRVRGAGSVALGLMLVLRVLWGAWGTAGCMEPA